MPAEAQAAIDGITEDIAAGRADEIYEQAAEEWRNTVSAAENKNILERVRTRLGRVQSRAVYAGKERNDAGGELPGHSLVVTYQTTFERAHAMETFTLLERGGRWLLAGYFVSSDALKQ